MNRGIPPRRGGRAPGLGAPSVLTAPFAFANTLTRRPARTNVLPEETPRRGLKNRLADEGSPGHPAPPAASRQREEGTGGSEQEPPRTSRLGAPRPEPQEPSGAGGSPSSTAGARLRSAPRRPPARSAAPELRQPLAGTTTHTGR